MLFKQTQNVLETGHVHVPTKMYTIQTCRWFIRTFHVATCEKSQLKVKGRQIVRWYIFLRTNQIFFYQNLVTPQGFRLAMRCDIRCISRSCSKQRCTTFPTKLLRKLAANKAKTSFPPKKKAVAAVLCSSFNAVIQSSSDKAAASRPIALTAARLASCIPSSSAYVVSGYFLLSSQLKGSGLAMES